MKLILIAAVALVALLVAASPFTVFGAHNEPWVPLTLAAVGLALIAFIPIRR